jgi:hypothetical protein
MSKIHGTKFEMLHYLGEFDNVEYLLRYNDQFQFWIDREEAKKLVTWLQLMFNIKVFTDESK